MGNLRRPRRIVRPAHHRSRTERAARISECAPRVQVGERVGRVCRHGGREVVSPFLSLLGVC